MTTRERAWDERLLRGLSWLLALAVAVLCAARDLRLTQVGDVLAATSILAGFLFGSLVFMFQLRLRITDDVHVPTFGRLRALIDRSFARLAEAVGVAVAATALAALADVTAHTPATGAASVSRWWTAAIALTGIRLLTLVPMLVWDQLKAYREIPG